jgi:MFS family permease
VYSLLSDYFPAHKRGMAIGIYSSGVYIGMGLSLPLGGWVAQTWNRTYAGGGAPLDLAGWQAAFLVVGIPGLLIAVLAATLREPLRGAADGQGTPVVLPNAWRNFAHELIAIIPPFTLWSVARYPGALRRNLVIAAVVATAGAALIYITGDAPQWIAYGLGVYAVLSWVQVLRFKDRPTYELIWRTPTVLLCLVGFGGLAFFVYSYGFWTAPFAIRTFGIDKQAAGTLLGLPAAAASALGVIAGGRLSDWWKARDPRGRVFVGMLAGVLPMPFMVAMFTADSFQLYATLSPIVYLFSSMWLGAAGATAQELVLPRMRGVVTATYVLGNTMIGLALGPYATGKVATVTGSLQLGIFSVFLVLPIALVALWLVAQRIASVEASRFERARVAGEPAQSIA